MNEQIWLSASTPLLTLLQKAIGETSKRKLRLFGCACCRRVWKFLSAAASREAVEVAEKFADGLATADELERANNGAAHDNEFDAASGAARMVCQGGGALACAGAWRAMSLAAWRNGDYQAALAEFTPLATEEKNALIAYPTFEQVEAREKAVQADLLRDIVGNPFRPVTLDASLLDWRDRTVVRIAQSIYDDRSFEPLGILGDALEEAGCMNTALLSHCRSKGPHARGCWAVDLVLGKQ